MLNSVPTLDAQADANTLSPFILNGAAIAAKLRQNIAKKVSWLRQVQDITPGLAVVLVGEDPASQVYVRSKGRQTREVGMASFEHKLPIQTTEAELLALVQRLNTDPAVHGILVQLPLPEHLNAKLVINAIDPEKDVDGFHAVNIGRLSVGQPALVPCTPLGCLMILRSYHESLAGKEAVVVGRSAIVGRPMGQLLLRENCTVTMAHRHTKSLSAVCRRADILVVAVGRPEMFTKEFVKPGATIIDVGINRVFDEGGSRLVGDVEFKSVSKIAGAITPVPGGVGPMTLACLMSNTLTACWRIHSVKEPLELSA